MIKTIKDKIKNLEVSIKKVVKAGCLFSFDICIFSAILLLTYEIFYHSPNLYYIGLSLLKSGLMFIVFFIICGFTFDTIKKQMI